MVHLSCCPPIQLSRKKAADKPAAPETKKEVKFPPSEVGTQTSAVVSSAGPSIASVKGRRRSIAERDATPYPSGLFEPSDMSFLTVGSEVAKKPSSSGDCNGKGANSAITVMSSSSNQSSNASGTVGSTACGGSSVESGSSSYVGSVTSSDGYAGSKGSSLDQLHSASSQLRDDMNIAILKKEEEALEARLAFECKLSFDALKYVLQGDKGWSDGGPGGDIGARRDLVILEDAGRRVACLNILTPHLQGT